MTVAANRAATEKAASNERGAEKAVSNERGAEIACPRGAPPGFAARMPAVIAALAGKPVVDPGIPLRILYVCSQRPGYGGAATESYEAIRRLRGLGHDVHGKFLVGPEDRDHCDPDLLGGIDALVPGREDPSDGWARGPWDIAVGKNTWAPEALANPRSGRPPGAPIVYITSSVDAFALRGIGAAIEPGSSDWRAFEAASCVVVHSTFDLAAYRTAAPETLTRKIIPEVIRTSALAVGLDARPTPALAERRWDLCLAASSWGRTLKGGAVAARICGMLGDRVRIVVCGEKFGSGGGLARLQPAPPRADRLGLVSHRDMLEILRQSKVVAIPSLYDSSPNLYVEAVAAGCNVVVSPCVGNIEGHPPEFLAPVPTAEAFAGPILAAVQASRQAPYRVETAERAAMRLSAWLGVIARWEGRYNG